MSKYLADTFFYQGIIMEKITRYISFFLFSFMIATASFTVGASRGAINKPTPLVKLPDCGPTESKLQKKTDELIVALKEKEDAVADKKDVETHVPSMLHKAQILVLKKYYLLLRQSDESLELRTGGNPSWRNNNPGKISFNNFARSYGAIGNDGPMAVFGSYDEGRKALEDLLFASELGYKSLSLGSAIKRFAPAKQGYNPVNYIKAIVKDAKVSEKTVMTMFTADQRGDIMDAIQKFENFTAGNVMHYDNEEDFKEKGWN